MQLDDEPKQVICDRTTAPIILTTPILSLEWPLRLKTTVSLHVGRTGLLELMAAPVRLLPRTLPGQHVQRCRVVALHRRHP